MKRMQTLNPLCLPGLRSLQYDAVGDAIASIAELFPQDQEKVAADKRQGHLSRREEPVLP